MQVVLEAVADAVSQLILFSVEAEENKSVLPNVTKGASGVAKAVQILINIGEGLAAKYGSEEKIQRDMRSACARLRNATSTLEDLAREISASGFTERSKVNMLGAARAILENTVTMLQLADSFDVIQISKAGHYVETEFSNLRNARNNDDLAEAVRAFTHRVTNLLELSRERISLLADVTFKRRLQAANSVLEGDSEPYLNACRELVQYISAAPAVRERSELVARGNEKRLQEAVTEIILVARLSSQHMWDKVNLDINALIRGKLPPLEALRHIGRDLDANIDKLRNAVTARSRPDADEAMKAIQDAVNQEAALATAVSEMSQDPVQKRQLVQAIEDLEKMPEQVSTAADRAIENPFDPRYLDALNKALERLKKANQDLLDKARSAPDRILDAQKDIDKDLDRLVEAAKKGDVPGVAQAINDLKNDIAREGDAARTLAQVNHDDPLAPEKVERALEALNKMPPKLQQSAKTVLDRPNDPEAQRQLDKDVAATRDLAQKMKEAALPPEKEIEHKAKELEENLGKLADALKEGRKDDAMPLMKSVPRDIEDQAKRVEKFADKVDDPVLKRQFMNDAKDLRNQNPPLIKAAKALLQDPRDPAARRALDETIEAINTLNDRIVQNANAEADRQRDLEGDLLKALDRLKKGLKNLTDAALRGDQPGAIEAVKDATGEMNKEAELAKRLAENLPERDRQAALNEAQHLQDLAAPLVNATKDALSNPSPANQDKLEKVAQEVKDTASRIPEKLNLSPDKQLAKHAKELNDLLDQLYDAAKNQKKEPFENLNKIVPKKIDEQADRATRFADATDDPVRRKQLLADGTALKKIPPPLQAAAQAVFENPRNQEADQKLQDLIDQVKAINRRLADPNAAFATPADRVIKDVEDTRAAAHEGNKPRTEEALRALKTDVPELIQSANETAKQCDDPVLKKNIAKAVGELEKFHPQVRPAATAAAANPRDQHAQAKLDDLLDKVRALAEQLGDAELNASPEKQALDNMDDIDKVIEQLKDAIAKNDKPRANENLAHLVDDLKKQAALARKMGDQSDDPERKKKFYDIANKLENVIPRLENVVKRLLANPFDREALKELDAICDEIRLLNDQLADLMRAENQSKLEKAMDKLMDAVKKGEDTTPILKEIANLLKKQAAIAKALAARTNDPRRRRELLQAAKDLQDAIRQIVDASRGAAGGNKEGQKKLEDVINRTLDISASIRNVSDDPLEAAAQQIQDDLQSKRKFRTLEDQPEGSAAWRLLNASRRIGELMQKLAEAAKNKSKKDIILLSKEIAGQVDIANKAAAEIASDCRDPRLRDALLAHAAPLKTYAVQLKILTAVKASTAEDDKSTKQQLVTCAKGIANAVVASVKAAEAAMIVALRK